MPLCAEVSLFPKEKGCLSAQRSLFALKVSQDPVCRSFFSIKISQDPVYASLLHHCGYVAPTVPWWVCSLPTVMGV